MHSTRFHSTAMEIWRHSRLPFEYRSTTSHFFTQRSRTFSRSSIIQFRQVNLYFEFLESDSWLLIVLLLLPIRRGFFAGASFMSFQQCEFNFGSQPFRFPPKGVSISAFNDHATLRPEQKIILPRYVVIGNRNLQLLKLYCTVFNRPKRLDQLRLTNIHEDSCSLCCDAPATVTLLPCNHQ